MASTGTTVPAGSPMAAVDVRLDTVVGPLLLSANLTSTGNRTTWASQSFPLTDPGGGHQLFVVFRSVPGGQGGNKLFNLNWVEFVGDGIASSAPQPQPDPRRSAPAADRPPAPLYHEPAASLPVSPPAPPTPGTVLRHIDAGRSTYAIGANEPSLGGSPIGPYCRARRRAVRTPRAMKATPTIAMSRPTA